MSMRPFRSLITYEEARSIILKNARPIEDVERIRVRDALGRVIASDQTSEMDVPPFDRAAMDGYAVRAQDTFEADKFKPAKLRSMDVIYAGDEPKGALKEGECIEIATGAIVPHGADAVVMVEDTEKDGDEVNVFRPMHPRANVSKRGEDIKIGDIVMRKGDCLNPSKVGVLSALGFTDVDVYRQPKIAMIPTGSEIQETGKELRTGQVYDINSYTLAGIIRENGCVPVIHDIVEDELESIDDALHGALVHDGVVFSGGSSVGTRDILRDVLSKHGEILFHGIQIKPGKPTLCAKIEDRIVFGMPGYPTACLTNGYLILAPYLCRLSRLAEKVEQTVSLPLGKRVVSTLGRHQFLTVKMEGGKAMPVFKESGAITSMAYADGYIEIPINVDLVEKGEIVDVKLF